MEYIKIGGSEYPASISGRLADGEWDGRATKTIKAQMTYAQAMALFVDGAEWSIISESVDEETGEASRVEFDNSDYNIAGPITDMRNGTVSVKMGKHTALEEAQELVNILMGEEA